VTALAAAASAAGVLGYSDDENKGDDDDEEFWDELEGDECCTVSSHRDEENDRSGCTTTVCTCWSCCFPLRAASVALIFSLHRTALDGPVPLLYSPFLAISM